mmetsp:Transcript_88777/g.153748  ORF Transcript_88777/g.153748 Transcript_88777/m.153748 type:complete len:772 (+) Transcript_88777:55-2370(+)
MALHASSPHLRTACPFILVGALLLAGQYGVGAGRLSTQQQLTVEVDSQGKYIDLSSKDAGEPQSQGAVSNSMMVDIIDHNILSAALRTEALETDPGGYEPYLKRTTEIIANPSSGAAYINDEEFQKMAIYDLIRTYMKTAVNGIHSDYKGSGTDRLQKMSHTVGSLFEGSFKVDKADTRLKGMLETTAEYLEVPIEFYQKLSDADIIIDPKFYVDSMTAINPRIDACHVGDGEEVTIHSCPKRVPKRVVDTEGELSLSQVESKNNVKDGWLKSKPLEWLQDDMKHVYSSDLKRFAIGQAGKVVQVEKPNGQAISFGNLQPFRCTSIEKGRNSGLWIDRNNAGKHDFAKARLYDLVNLAVRNRVLYTFANAGNFAEVLSIFKEADRDIDKDVELCSRLEIAFGALKEAGPNRFALFEDLRSTACRALKSGSNPRTQAQRLSAYINSVNDGSTPALVMLQEVAASVFPEIDKVLGGEFDKPEYKLPNYAQLIKPNVPKFHQADNSAILVSKNFLQTFFGGSPYMGTHLVTSGKEVERRLLISYESTDKKQLILGSVHFSSQKGGEAVMENEFKPYVTTILETMHTPDPNSIGQRMAIFGGDLNMDPRPPEVTSPGHYEDLQKMADDFGLHLTRLTSPIERYSYLKKLSPLQSQVAKIDKEDFGAIDHIFIIIPKAWAITQKGATDEWMTQVVSEVFGDKDAAVTTSEPDAGSKDFANLADSGNPKMSGFMQYGQTYLPATVSSDQETKLGTDKTYVLSSDHLPVRVAFELNMP